MVCLARCSVIIIVLMDMNMDHDLKIKVTLIEGKEYAC